MQRHQRKLLNQKPFNQTKVDTRRSYTQANIHILETGKCKNGIMGKKGTHKRYNTWRRREKQKDNLTQKERNTRLKYTRRERSQLETGEMH